MCLSYFTPLLQKQTRRCRGPLQVCSFVTFGERWVEFKRKAAPIGRAAFCCLFVFGILLIL